MKKKFILLLFILLTSFITAQQNVETLQAKLDNLLSGNFFESTLAAVDVYDLTQQKILYQKNNKMLLHPASNMKILSSAAGLIFLGGDYLFQTKLFYTGKIINETLYGDLFVSGGCDPDFTGDDLDSLVFAISALGIKEILGNLFGDVSMTDSLFWGKGWMWDDDPSIDAPYLSALSINKNSLVVSANGTNPELPVTLTIQPETNYVDIENDGTTVALSDTNTLTIDRDWLNRKNTIIVKGSLKQYDRKVVKLNMYKPELYFLTLFKEKLNKAGIRLTGSIRIFDSPSDAEFLYSFNRLYDSILVSLNKESDNLSAEMVLRGLSEKYSGKPATAENGIKLIDSLIILTGLKPSQYRIVDGSGVSHYNLVSAELILAVLKYMYSQHPELYGRLYNSFPIAGIDGTLKNRMKNTPAEGNVHAKTGTLSGVSCLSGYLTSKNGSIIAFSVLIQNHVKNTSAVLRFQDQICNILVNYK
ncbi:MAG: D-alanyl-D-alanine carboxypeptidase/D-alanyl-D-alanine-endopeptidase [Ignavibacteriaceae bacterium]